ncbi:transglutaminase-like cysteine peptidase [Prosthecodimorpha staleyi]|uniref:Transglutaminase-like cysteine peptidase n=1 Tax=Prosthecodimorpha staleyi TaxID=2840188 RepID=A0A947D3F4_9HYPH|nr:transglutaminase-like cysteine peptidase [Prosthecodimorpha staleyi]MBT9290278.1 transglutaminase-like cysteine peptidase [Prosthecodimorpha staleyi]
MMRRFLVCSLTVAAVATAAVTLSSLPAHAISLGGSATQFKKARHSFIQEGSYAVAPMGHVMFCLNSPSECRKPSLIRVTRIGLTDQRRAVLEGVNRAVNREILPVNDRSGPGIVDQWSLAPTSGDCEDFAITKRHRLIQAGWPASALRLAVGRVPNGEGHAVLVVKTRDGDLVLDNRSDAIRPWRATDIRWVSIQAAEDPRFWRSL